MHRELNPELFGVKSLREDAPLGLNSQAKTQENFGLQTSSGNRVPAPVAMEMKTLESQIHQLRLRLQATEKKNEMLLNQMQTLVQGANARFERTTQTITRVESSVNQ